MYKSPEVTNSKEKITTTKKVNFHRLKPVVFNSTGFAYPPLAVVSIHQLKLVVLKSEE
jgi:hypothetical protein